MVTQFLSSSYYYVVCNLLTCIRAEAGSSDDVIIGLCDVIILLVAEVERGLFVSDYSCSAPYFHLECEVFKEVKTSIHHHSAKLLRVHGQQ